jgi:glucose/arabinose dehydrogenase
MEATMPRSSLPLAAFLALSLAACGDSAKLSEQASTGPNPNLPAPTKTLIPTVNVASAKGWGQGQFPSAGADLAVKEFAGGLDHPRSLFVLPNGDVLVAETAAPERPGGGKGIKDWFKGYFMKNAGSATPSANRITLLRDSDGDGIAETRSPFLTGLNSPFGMALIGNDFYVANTDAVVRFPYKEGDMQITAPATKVTDLPGGPLNHHWTKGLVANKDGSRLFASVGSNSNVAENGLEAEEGRAAIWEIDPQSGQKRVYANGLRNPVDMAFHPATGELWTVVNERDELGSDLVPDYLTSVKMGGFYGWPFSYWGKNLDERVKQQDPTLIARAIVPDYALGNHVAPLGVAFYEGDLFPQSFKNGAFVGMHGSWNRKPRSGYKVVFIPFAEGKPNGEPIDVLTGFVVGDEALGRPVGVKIDKKGAVLVADDVGNKVWRVAPSDRLTAGTERRGVPN